MVTSKTLNYEEDTTNIVHSELKGEKAGGARKITDVRKAENSTWT